MDCSLTGSSAHGIFQARILEWVFHIPGDPSDLGIESASLASSALAGGSFTIGTTWEASGLLELHANRCVKATIKTLAHREGWNIYHAWLLGLVTKSCLTLAIHWTVACQAPLPMGFSRQEYQSGLPFPSSLINLKSNNSRNLIVNLS